MGSGRGISSVLWWVGLSVLGRPKAFRNLELEIRGNPDSAFSAASSASASAFSFPGMAFNPGDGYQATSSLETRDHPVNGEGVTLPGSCSRVSGMGDGAGRVKVDDHRGEVTPLQELLDGSIDGGSLDVGGDSFAAQGLAPRVQYVSAALAVLGADPNSARGMFE